MKYILVIFTLIIFAFKSYSQASCYVNPPEIPDSEKVFLSVHEMPEFPGGDEGIMKFIETNIVYPDSAKKNHIEGIVYVYFVINRVGNVENAKVVRGIKGANDLNKEALRLVNAMPTWEPGKHNCNKVKVTFTLPVKFALKMKSSTSNSTIEFEKLYNLNVVDSDNKCITYKIKANKKASTYYFYDEGVKCFEKLKYKTAIDLFQAALSITNNDVDALYNCGVCYSKLNDFENACKCWHKIKAMNLNDANQLIKDNCK
jgi:TonB family protein